MADMLYYPGLTPPTALELLASIATHDGAGNLLTRLEVNVQPRITYHIERAVTLGLRSPVGKLPRAAVQAQEAFDEAYRSLAQRANPVAVDPAGGPYWPLPAGLPKLLLACDVADDPALEDPDTQLIVALDLDDAQAGALLEELNLFAPPVSVAARQQADGTTCHYYLVNDRSFTAVDAWDAGRPAACSAPLHCFYVERSGVRLNAFLPRTTAPNRSALENTLAILLKTAPVDAWDAPLPEPQAVLAVVPPDNGDDAGQVHYLANLQFVARVWIQPLVDDLANFEVFVGDGSPAVQEELQAALAQLEPQIGYRLRLRPAFHRSYDEGRYQEARRREDEAINERLLLESQLVARPMLLRFTQEQLSALADVLRAHPIADSHRLLYAFQASSFRYPGGAHYLLVDPAIVLEDLDPIVYWEGQVEQPMRFWIDPYWAIDYYQGDLAAQVYVPYGAVLYPTLHSLPRVHMDAYLDDILLRWRQAGDAAPDPQTAIYVFDGQTDRQLDVFVLDRQAFQPLRARLAWLNDCLSVQGVVGVKEMISQLAASETRTRLAQAFADEEAAVLRTFDSARQRAEQTMIEHSHELLDVITAELTKVAKRAELLGQHAAQVNLELTALEADYREIVRLVSENQKLQQRVTAGADALETYTSDLVRKVEGVIRRAGGERERLQFDLKEDIQLLHNTHESLRRQFESLRKLLQ